jgi:hypothetical protein
MEAMKPPSESAVVPAICLLVVVKKFELEQSLQIGGKGHCHRCVVYHTDVCIAACAAHEGTPSRKLQARTAQLHITLLFVFLYFIKGPSSCTSQNWAVQCP